MQSPDSTRTEAQIRAPFNWHSCLASGTKHVEKHPLVAAAWDSHSKQTLLKGFETLLVCILTTILLPGNFKTAENYKNHSVYPSLVINNSWLSV